MRYGMLVLWMLLCMAAPATAQVSINFSTPGVNIGINLPVYPQMQRVPGYPVYYAPNVSSNYFFFDGLYWVYEGDNWYESSWYNGPWIMVDPIYVPLYLLRVPVRYYRRAPVYFRGWRPNDAPRWDEHWGQSWTQRRSGWNQWDRNAAPAPAPLPAYQRQYSGSQYPQAAQQVILQTQSYRYQPRDTVAQGHFQHQRAQAQSTRQAAPQSQSSRQSAQQRQQSQQQSPQQVAPPQSEQRRQAPVVREPQAAREAPQRIERQSPQSPALREQHPQRNPATENPRPGREQGRDQGRGRDNKDHEGKDKDKDEKEPRERGRDR